MMVQDQYSGYIHEVPEPQMGYGLGEVVYDGFGNAVGWNPFDTISDVVSGARTVVRGAVEQSRAGRGQIVGQVAQAPFRHGGQNRDGQGISPKRRSGDRQLIRACPVSCRRRAERRFRIPLQEDLCSRSIRFGRLMSAACRVHRAARLDSPFAALHRTWSAPPLYALRRVARTAGPGTRLCGEHAARRSSREYPASLVAGNAWRRPSESSPSSSLDRMVRLDLVDLSANDAERSGEQRMSYFHERPSDDESRSRRQRATSSRRRGDYSKRLLGLPAPRVVHSNDRSNDTGGIGGYGGIAGLVYTKDHGETRRTYIHFMDDPPRLMCDADGRQLYVLGGSYRITHRGIEG